MLIAAERRSPMVSSGAVACGPSSTRPARATGRRPNARGLLRRVLLFPWILDVGDRIELHIGELAVLHLGLAHIDVLDDVAGGGIARDRTARAVGGLPVGQELDRLVARELALGLLDQVERPR